MEVKVIHPVFINFIHLIKDKDTGKDKYWSFQIWLGKTGYGSVKDRYRNGRCYDLKSVLRQENWTSKNGKSFWKAKLYNCVFEIMDYDSIRDKDTKELWILKKFDEVADKPNWGEENNIVEEETIIQDDKAFGTQIIPTGENKTNDDSLDWTQND